MKPIRATETIRRDPFEGEHMNTTVEVTSEVKTCDRQVIADGMRAFNAQYTSSANSTPLAVLVRRDGNVVGGFVGRTWVDWFSMEMLWLPDSMRGSGLGPEILRLAETEAIRRGCLGAYLETFSFQAPGLYERLGYSIIATIDDMPVGHKHLFFCKRYSPAAEFRPDIPTKNHV